MATGTTVRGTWFGSRPSAEGGIASVDGTPVGVAVWFHNYSTFLSRRGLYLEDLFVLPEWRGRGVGGAMRAERTDLRGTSRAGSGTWSNCGTTRQSRPAF